MRTFEAADYGEKYLSSTEEAKGKAVNLLI